jgi:hypothetical protein
MQMRRGALRPPPPQPTLVSQTPARLTRARSLSSRPTDVFRNDDGEWPETPYNWKTQGIEDDEQRNEDHEQGNENNE